MEEHLQFAQHSQFARGSAPDVLYSLIFCEFLEIFQQFLYSFLWSKAKNIYISDRRDSTPPASSKHLSTQPLPALSQYIYFNYLTV